MQKGLSQERLALEARVDRSYVGGVERGSENVTLDFLVLIANALEVPIATLLIEPPKDALQPRPLRAGRKAKADL